MAPGASPVDPTSEPVRRAFVTAITTNATHTTTTTSAREAIVGDEPIMSPRVSQREESQVAKAIDPLQRHVAGRAVVLLAIAMVTGLWAGVALSGKVVVPIPHLALAAHLNALFGCLWLLGFAFTLPMLRYSDQAKWRLATLQIVPNYGNWLITLIASFLGVRGIDFQGKLANDIVAVALMAVVVVPALAATFAWAWGFFRQAPNAD